VKIRGFRYHYVDEGNGDPIIMVHGNPTWSFYYRNLIQALRFGYRTLAPDHLGCGLSDKPDESEYSFTLEQRVEDLEEFVSQLNLKKITLVLHDWGGMIGMAFAVRHPHLIERIIVSNTGAFRMPTTKKFPWQLSLARTKSVGRYLILNHNAFSRAASKLCVARRELPQPIKEAYYLPYNNKRNRLAVYNFVKDIPLTERDPSYSIVAHTEKNLALFNKTPMLVLWGAKDFVFDDHFLNQWKSHFPHAVVHRFADVGHYILEDAWQEVVPIVKRFLANNPI
jgi:haloalkane dehalogenase